MSHPVFTKKRLLVFLLHWLAWIVLFSLTYLPTYFTSVKIVWSFVAYKYLLVGTLDFLLFYFVAFYLLPQIGTKNRRWILFVVACVLLAIGYTYFKYLVEQLRLTVLLARPNGPSIGSRMMELADITSKRSFTFFKSNADRTIVGTIAIITLGFAYRLLLAWYMQEKVRQELENKKLQAELSFLKMQVNPHFLFNALNNIYSLAVMEKSAKTGNSIMKLSELMRYVLYEKEDEANKVSLDKEIRHINSFIDLEKLRHVHDIYINFSIEGDTAGKRIVPLLLFPLIENACKHGILTDADKPVEISLNATGSMLSFTCENYINTYQKDKNGGIGLVNVQKRLELLYGSQYPLTTQNDGQKFIVSLQLPL
ncbi:MAG TPA: histidine kinase [Phnomibacter sp.]|nr:histidine kinase [Phnomibacter sp.]